MEKCKNNLKISSIILIVSGLLSSTYVIRYSVLLWIIAGVILWISSKEEAEIRKNKSILFCIAIFLIFVNFLAAIFLFMAIDKLTGTPSTVNPTNGPPIVKKKKEIDPEVKKIDILLKLGVGMILVSGILIATTSWSFISDIGKLFFLLFFSGIFLGLSIFTEKKLNLYNTSFMYWILSMAFLLLIIIAILYFKIAGDFLSYTGLGMNLAYGITFFTLTGLSLATYLKYGKNEMLYAVYSGVYITITFLLRHFLPSTIIYLILSSIILAVSILSKKESVLFAFNKIASYILLLGLITCNKASYEIPFLLLTCITVGNMFYMAYLSTKEDDKITSLWISHIFLPIAIYNCSFLRDYAYLIIFILASMFAIWMKEKKNNNYKTYYNYHFIIYTILSIICILSSEINTTMGLLISTLYVAVNALLEFDNPYVYSTYLEPVSIGIFIMSLFTQSFLNVSYSQIFTIICMVFSILHFFSNNNRKSIYLFSTIFSIILSIISNIFDKEGILSIFIIIPSIYLVYMTKQNTQEEKYIEKLLFTFIVLLITIYNFFYIINWFDLGVIISSLIFLFILGTIILLSKEEMIKKTCYFTIGIPLLKMIGEINDETYRPILMSIIILYIDFLIVKFLTNNSNSKDEMGLIGIIIAILFVLPINNYIVGIYIGLLGLITIMIGFSNNEYKSFFKGGVIMTILNILYQLREVWGQIPFSFYLLIGGLGIIGFVTYKEIKNKK